MFTVRIQKPWTLELFLESYCVERKKPIRRKMKKLQAVTVIYFAACGFLISHLIGHRTIKMSKSNQSVHGFWIRTVIDHLHYDVIRQAHGKSVTWLAWRHTHRRPQQPVDVYNIKLIMEHRFWVRILEQNAKKRTTLSCFWNRKDSKGTSSCGRQGPRTQGPRGASAPPPSPPCIRPAPLKFELTNQR